MATFGIDAGTSHYYLPASILSGSRFQNDAATGTLTKLELFFREDSPNGNVRLGVFADDAGAPGALLLDAGEVAVADEWVEISGLSLAVTLGAYYWLAFVMSAQNNVKYYGDYAANCIAEKAHTYGALPNPFGTPSEWGNSPYVLRATVEAEEEEAVSFGCVV